MNRFAKLFSTMGQPTPQSNPGIDDKMIENKDLQNKLQMIDAKIAELEASDDPNALESLNFWKAHRAQLAAD